jgi:hypothetical protein
VEFDFSRIIFKVIDQLNLRNQNSVKNRFYTSIRHLLKVIYRSPVSPKRFPGEIDSKYLYDFYHGRDGMIFIELRI